MGQGTRKKGYVYLKQKIYTNDGFEPGVFELASLHTCRELRRFLEVSRQRCLLSYIAKVTCKIFHRNILGCYGATL